MTSTIRHISLIRHLIQGCKWIIIFLRNVLLFLLDIGKPPKCALVNYLLPFFYVLGSIERQSIQLLSTTHV